MRSKMGKNNEEDEREQQTWSKYENLRCNNKKDALLLKKNKTKHTNKKTVSRFVNASAASFDQDYFRAVNVEGAEYKNIVQETTFDSLVENGYYYSL